MDSVIRVLLADDHPMVRKGLKMSMEEYEDIQVIAEAGDGEAALRLIRQLVPDVAILDVDMPKLDGLAVAREVNKLSLKTKIIFLTLHGDVDFLNAAFDAGGQGYIQKDSGAEDIVAGIRAVAAGQMFVSPGMTRHLVQRQNAPKPQSSDVDKLHNLTPSERTIMKLIAKGKASKEIADEIGIHYRTVENHRTNICRKLEIEGGSNALLRFALQNQGKF
jgi:DNA-binding NarL/FixJ family response regulator